MVVRMIFSALGFLVLSIIAGIVGSALGVVIGFFVGIMWIPSMFNNYSGYSSGGGILGGILNGKDKI